MFCPKCGSGIEDNTKYCPFCGEILDAADEAYTPRSRGDGLRTGVSRKAAGVGSFFSSNIFRLLITAIMSVSALTMTIAFFNDIGTAYSILSGLEKKDAAISTFIYVLAVSIPVLMSLETIRKTFYIPGRVSPKEFNIRKHAVSKRALVPAAAGLLACLVLVISPFILYNYRDNDAAASLNVILESCRYPAVICCVLCAAATTLILFSRKRVRQSKVLG